jgi:hypothetical protein
MAVNAGLLEFCRSAAYLRFCPAAEASSEGYFITENRTPERFGWANGAEGWWCEAGQALECWRSWGPAAPKRSLDD